VKNEEGSGYEAYVEADTGIDEEDRVYGKGTP
jgi:hypothetical protein